MPLEPSVHDNRLLSYTVDAEERRVTLHTAYFGNNAREYTSVVFSKVLAFHFEGDAFGTILFDIQEVAAAVVIAEYRRLFSRNKAYGWPPLEYTTEDDFGDALCAKGINTYLIQSSCGMSGFVMAATLQVIPGKE